MGLIVPIVGFLLCDLFLILVVFVDFFEDRQFKCIFILQMRSLRSRSLFTDVVFRFLIMKTLSHQFIVDKRYVSHHQSIGKT